jgi:hypothetical protein
MIKQWLTRRSVRRPVSHRSGLASARRSLRWIGLTSPDTAVNRAMSSRVRVLVTLAESPTVISSKVRFSRVAGPSVIVRAPEVGARGGVDLRPSPARRGVTK